MSKHSENGVRVFTNEMVNQTIYVDKTSLEDLLKFQSVEWLLF